MKSVLITGATSGIGQEFARAYAKREYRLILVARREKRMQDLAYELGVDCRIIVADLSQESECKKLLETIADENIDIFINNAGFGTAGAFTDTDLDKEISMIHVNDIAMHILFKGILKQMVKKNSGHILNVCSSAGLLPGGPYMATYYASKSYMVSLTRAVNHELREAKSKVKLSALCPGPVDTEFNDNADVVFALKGISASRCVKETLKAMDRGRLIIVPSFIMKLAVFFQKLLPSSLLVALTAHQQKKKIRLNALVLLLLLTTAWPLQANAGELYTWDYNYYVMGDSIVDGKGNDYVGIADLLFNDGGNIVKDVSEHGDYVTNIPFSVHNRKTLYTQLDEIKASVEQNGYDEHTVVILDGGTNDLRVYYAERKTAKSERACNITLFKNNGSDHDLESATRDVLEELIHLYGNDNPKQGYKVPIIYVIPARRDCLEGKSSSYIRYMENGTKRVMIIVGQYSKYGVIPLNTGLTLDATCFYDNIHPNQEGYDRIIDQIYDTLDIAVVPHS